MKITYTELLSLVTRLRARRWTNVRIADYIAQYYSYVPKRIINKAVTYKENPYVIFY